MLHVITGGNMAPVFNSMLCIHETAMLITLDGREEKGF